MQGMTRLQRFLEIILLVFFMVIFVATFFYALNYWEISKNIQLPGCFLYENFGLKCPACGGSRTLNNLVKGNLLGALYNNFVVTVSVPLCLYYGIKISYYIIKVKDLTKVFINTNLIWLWMFFIIFFTIIRNIV